LRKNNSDNSNNPDNSDNSDNSDISYEAIKQKAFQSLSVFFPPWEEIGYLIEKRDTGNINTLKGYIEQADALLEAYEFKGGILSCLETEEITKKKSGGNPNFRKPDEKEIKKVVDKANELLKSEKSKYKPLKKGAYLSNSLKEELADQLNMPTSTVSDWLKKYCEKKENGYFEVKTAILR
jgi:hypothetical protein